MRIDRILEIIDKIRNLQEGEKYYYRSNAGFILTNGLLTPFEGDETFRPRYTKKQYINIMNKKIMSILKCAKGIYRLLNFTEETTNINLLDAQFCNIIDEGYHGIEVNIIYGSKENNKLIIIVYNKSHLHQTTNMTVFNIDYKNFCMTLSLFEADYFLETIDYYKSSGKLSMYSAQRINKYINGEINSSPINISQDMYFDNYSNHHDMIKNIKVPNCLKKKKVPIDTK